MASGNMITSDELAQFKSLAVKKKVDSMELYLIGANGYKYNMQEVGARVFGDENYSYTVSLIHRCYNFAGQNGGKYRNGCKFEQTYGYRVSRKDIEAFVKKYPNGTFNNGVTFEDFLRTRVNSAQKASAPKAPSKQQRQSVPRQNNQVQRMPQQQFNYQNTGYNNDPMMDKKFRGIMIAVGSIGAGILLIMLLSGNLFRHWIIALIILFITIGAFGSTKEM